MIVTLTQKQEATTEILKSRTSIKKWIVDCNIDRHTVTSLAERLTLIAAKMNEDAEALAASQAEKRKKVTEFLAMMEEQGLTIEDFGNIPTPSADGRKNRVDPLYKIQYVNADGKKVIVERKLIGRLPPDIKAYLEDTGKTLKECIVGDDKPDEEEINTALGKRKKKVKATEEAPAISDTESALADALADSEA